MSSTKSAIFAHGLVLALVMLALGMFHTSAIAVNCPNSPTVIPAGTTYTTGCVLNSNGVTLTIDGASGGASAGAINDAQGTGISIQGNNTTVINNGLISANTGIFNCGFARFNRTLD